MEQNIDVFDLRFLQRVLRMHRTNTGMNQHNEILDRTLESGTLDIAPTYFEASSQSMKS